ncbi:MAG: DODA-type extradiol aromatic ring-opening family dioxygenase [Polaromonas sp.]
MTSTANTPVLFISHGAPTFATEPSRLGPLLQSLGTQLPAVTAVLVVSPHWQTHSVAVMRTARPDTVHDFGGFAPDLYTQQYPVNGAPAQANAAGELLSAAGWPVAYEDRRGLDHGAWVPLRHLLPAGQVPVFQVSMPVNLTTTTAVALGQALAPLRAQGVLIVASGSMTHNLYDFRPSGGQPETYAQAFTAWVQAAVRARALQPLIDYRAQAPHAVRAHPSEEHFLPLLVALGATTNADAVRVLPGGIDHAALSMESYVWGMH